MDRDLVEFVVIDQLVPKEHLLRKIDAAVDFTQLYEMVEPLYCEDNGRPSIDPVVLFKMVLIQHLYGLPSLRRTADEVSANNCYRWFLGYPLQEETPHFSTVSYNFRHRFTEETVDRVFAWILDEVAKAGYPHMNKKGVLPVLPKALFLSTIEKIRQQEARIDEFDKALSKMCDGFPAFDKDNLYLLALRDLLKYTMQDQYDNIGWWLYEAPDAGYTVSWEEAGKEVSVDLTEAGALYVKKSGCEFLIYKQNDDNLNRNQRKIEYNKTNTQK